MTETAKLKPCHRCGAPADLTVGDKMTRCTNLVCNISILLSDRAMWNLRPLESELLAALERMKSMAELLVRGRPVRDYQETMAEADALFSKHREGSQ